MPRYDSLLDVMNSLEDDFRPDRAKGLTCLCQCHYSGEGGGDWFFEIKDDKLTLNPGITGRKADVTFSSTAQDWLDACNGKASPVILFMKRKLKVKGSIGLAQRLTYVFF